MFICRENSRRSWILLFPDRPKLCPLTKTRNRRCLRSSRIVGNKLFFPTHPGFLRWLAIIPNKWELKFVPSGTSAMVFTDNQSFCICCYKFRAKCLPREFISFNLRVSQSVTSESQNSAVFFFWDPGRINVGRWNERSALHLMCDAEYEWHERSFRASGALQGRRNFPFCKPEILFSFCNFRLQC